LYDCKIDFQQSEICFVHSETTDMCVICGVNDTSAPLSILERQDARISSMDKG